MPDDVSPKMDQVTPRIDEVSPGVKAAFAHLTDLDPHGVPIKLAATILIVDDRPDLHVMMLRRRARSEFVGGMMVFPGGGLDAEGCGDDLGSEHFAVG